MYLIAFFVFMINFANGGLFSVEKEDLLEREQIERSYAKASCFNVPETLSSDEIVTARESGTLDMSWSFGEKRESHFRFVTDENEVYLELCIVGKALALIDEEIFDFLKIGRTEAGEEYRYFTYIFSHGKEEFFFVPLRSDIYSSPDSSTYLVHERRILSEQPTEVDDGFLYDRLVNGRVAIYTGAGISAAAGVPTMGQLNDLLGFEEREEFIKSLGRVVQTPLETAKRVRLFHNACFKSGTTAAHQAISVLTKTYGIPVMTENLDCLHEVSGIQPYRINADEIRREVSQEEACKIDYIVCIGLSRDDRGFLGWYKHMNPKGKILAIDISKPSYLGSDDYLLDADLQEVLPLVREYMSQDFYNKPMHYLRNYQSRHRYKLRKRLG